LQSAVGVDYVIIRPEDQQFSDLDGVAEQGNATEKVLTKLTLLGYKYERESAENSGGAGAWLSP
jgi:hypothetical protein